METIPQVIARPDGFQKKGIPRRVSMIERIRLPFVLPHIYKIVIRMRKDAYHT
jgi:hypothetical protein